MEEEPGRYHTFWPRVGAIFLDGAALAPLGWLDILIWNSAAGPLLLLAWAIFNALVFVGYEIGFVAKFGQTPGKMVCGVRIVSVGGEPVSLRQAALRQIVPLISMVVCLFIQAQDKNLRMDGRAYSVDNGDGLPPPSSARGRHGFLA